jgi:predicted HD phosphohydrolase
MIASSVDEIGGLLHRWAAVEEPVAGDVPAVLVAHGTVCADLLAEWHSEDLELQVAGLLHDVGLLLYPGDELGHPAHGARYVRRLLGTQTARLIELHVDAQRYLELTTPGYAVTPPPTAAFALQPDPMSAASARAFEQDPLFAAALELRRADDAASDQTVRADAMTLQRQLQRVRSLAVRIGSASPGSAFS